MKKYIIFLFLLLQTGGFLAAQDLTNYEITIPQETGEPSGATDIRFNGYTNHWHDYYTHWHRYGNLFKIAVPDIPLTILQSKVDVAEDLGMPGLLMQEGFISHLFARPYKTIENPTLEEMEKAIGESNVLVITDSSTELGKKLEKKAEPVFIWTKNLTSHQWDAEDLKFVKAFYLKNGNNYLFVISSSSQQQTNHLQKLIENTGELLDKYRMHKGWFGASSLLKSVTITPGHPLELIGYGMNEGNSWFVFDGYMDFLAKDELENWVNEVNLPVVTDVGFSPVYGCSDYDGFQNQDMATAQAWIDFSHSKGGYAFRPVYDPGNEDLQYDGYITHEGNKEQIDNEDVPFIHKTGGLSGNLTSSMVLFIEKEKSLTNETMWNAILERKEVAILEQAKMMGPARFRNALQLLYLDKYFLENYYGDNIDIQTKVDGYNLIVTLKNHSTAPVSGKLEIKTSPAITLNRTLPDLVALKENESKELIIPLQPDKNAMGKTNPVAVHFLWNAKNKSTVAMLDLPPAVSVHQLLYGQVPEVRFPATIHNFTTKNSFPVEVTVFEKDNPEKKVFQQSKTCTSKTAGYNELVYNLQLPAGNYIVKTSALGTTSESQLGVEEAEGKPYVYEVDLNSDGINEFRMENDSVMITLLRTGARVIEYIVKSKNDNVLFKIWPEKTYNHRRPFRMRGYYPYGGFEDFLGQGSMETHRIYDAKIVKKEGSYVQVEMESDYYGNHLKKIFTLYGNSPVLEVRFELDFKNPEANVLGPQPILEIGKEHGTEDVFIVPEMDGLKEFRMRPEEYYGRIIHPQEGWNAGYDTREDISFVGAFPVSQPIFLHMWMNHPMNTGAPHYYVEFQPWTPIIQKSKMYFSYYLWGSAGNWQNGVENLRKRNLITVRENDQ
jgi:hypothetical protein